MKDSSSESSVDDPNPDTTSPDTTSPHAPSPNDSEQNAASHPAKNRNARLGMTLFVIYLLLYLGFVLINAFSADTMETPAIAGLNLAIVYGFGLIIAALVMALVYGLLCKSDDSEAVH